MTPYFSYKADKIILAILFGLSIFIPLFIGVYQDDQLISALEKRNLTKLPAIPTSTQEINNYPKAFNSYYSDHFGLREQLTETYFSLIYKIGALHSVGGVTFGKEGWMFLGDIKLGSHPYDDPMGDAIHKNLFSNQQLENFAQSITGIKNWLKNKGIEYIYVIAPNKHSIYFDKMPTYISKQNKLSATDQLTAYLRQHTDVNILDLRPILLEERKKHQVYFKTDTHWNFYGANIAQFEIMKKIQKLFPKQITPILLKNNQFKFESKNDGDLTRFAKTGNISEEVAYPIFNSWCNLKQDSKMIKASGFKSFTCQPEGLNTLIFGDSFFGLLKPYIGRYFHRSTYIPSKIDYKKLQQNLKLVKPDIIIEEVVERNFPYVPQQFSQ